MHFRAIISVILLIILAASFVVAYAIWIEPYNLSVTENHFNFFESEGEPVKIVLITDTHGSYSDKSFFEQVKNKINALEPDLILISGDIVGDNDEGGISRLSELESAYGTYAVLGNHDYNDWDCSKPENYVFADNVTSTLEGLGIRVLRNEHLTLSINERSFSLIGVDDRWGCMNNYSKAAKGVPSSMPKIVLVHDHLSVKDETIKNGLILSGHTHCGQVNVPFITQYIIEKKAYGNMTGGKGTMGGSELYVSCGITPGGVRLFARPEISVMYLE
jgi:predicted MPP superfamily phosphohydrolase